jgi:hypothetical protein
MGKKNFFSSESSYLNKMLFFVEFSQSRQLLSRSNEREREEREGGERV